MADWQSRKGSFLIEVLAAFAILSLIIVPLLSSFSTGVRQTHTVKVYTAAQSLAEVAIALARTEVFLGVATRENNANLTADVSRACPNTAQQLEGLAVTRSIVPVGTSGKLFHIFVTVSWRDPYVESDRRVDMDTLERGEV